MSEAPTKLTMLEEMTILTDTVRKIHKYQQLYTNFLVNPYNMRALNLVTGKVTSSSDAQSGTMQQLDAYISGVLDRASDPPTKKYSKPQTTAQEVGWLAHMSAPTRDRRMHFPMHMSPMTKYMEFAWKTKEQSNMGN